MKSVEENVEGRREGDERIGKSEYLAMKCFPYFPLLFIL